MIRPVRLWVDRARAWSPWVPSPDLSRRLLIASLPLVVLVVSPDRVALSIGITVIFVVAALGLAHPTRSDNPVWIYGAVAGAFMLLALLRLEFISQPTPAQLSYGSGKALYFIIVMIPLSLAVASLVDRIEDLRPAVVIFMLLGIVLAVPTVLFHNARLLGESRYAVQGNLMTISLLLLLQFWIVRRVWLITPLVVVCVAAVALTASRQSVLAVIVGLVATAAFWLASRLVTADATAVPRRTYVLPVLLVTVLVVPLGGWLFLAFLHLNGVHILTSVPDPASCNCALTKFRELLTLSGQSATSGDRYRVRLLEYGVQLVAQHPWFGAGLGSFAGIFPRFEYPHNIVLEVAGETGLLGVVVLVLPLLAGWARLVVAGIRASSRPHASLAMLVLVFLVVANFSGDVPSARALWVFGLIALKFGWLAARPQAVRQPPPPAWDAAEQGQASGAAL